MSGAWPRVLQTETKTVRERGGTERVCVVETREYAAGTEGGQYQLWIDDRWAEDVTDDAPAPEWLDRVDACCQVECLDVV